MFSNLNPARKTSTTIEAMSAIPPEKLTELRQLVHSHVSKVGIQEQIRGCIAGVVSDGGSTNFDEEALLAVLESRGVVDHVMNTLDLSGLSQGSEVNKAGVGGGKHRVAIETEHDKNIVAKSEIPPQHGPHKRCLLLNVKGGRAFIEHLTDNTCSDCRLFFTLHVHFQNQRFHSKSIPCSCDPHIDEGFLLELNKHGTHSKESRSLSYTEALSLNTQINLVLTRTNSNSSIETVGTANLEWRNVLTEKSGKMLTSVELAGVGNEANVPAGILDLMLEILPSSREEMVHSEMLTAQLSLEKQRRDERERLFLVYTKQWWREYLEIRVSHSQRLVKIFAGDERGISRPVCSYVHPLRAGRLLDSPRHAARFVSLFPCERTNIVGNGGCHGDVWTTPHTLLAQKKGSCEDHCVLLCSLLLGFGLDAYICVGSKVKGVGHTWVMTLSYDGSVTFWESITGQRYPHHVYDPNTQSGSALPSPSHPYRTIGCVFNHQTFYANTQPTDSLLTCSFQLDNGALWKHMNTEAIRSVTSYPQSSVKCPPLMVSRVDQYLASSELEAQLRDLTQQHREELGLSTIWDDDLCHLLGPALASYETERCLGVGGVCTQEFQDAVRNAVPEGHSFKGFPVQLLHRDPHRAFATCLRSSVCGEVLGCRGDHVRLALRVRVCTYPEDRCAVWIMFAVKYQSIL